MAIKALLIICGKCPIKFVRRPGLSQKSRFFVIAGFYFRRTNKRNRRRRQIKFGRVRAVACNAQSNRALVSVGRCTQRPYTESAIMRSSLVGGTTKQSGYFKTFPDYFTSFAMMNRTFRDAPKNVGTTVFALILPQRERKTRRAQCAERFFSIFRLENNNIVFPSANLRHDSLREVRSSDLGISRVKNMGDTETFVFSPKPLYVAYFTFLNHHSLTVSHYIMVFYYFCAAKIN
jgi:hypothetical protein